MSALPSIRIALETQLAAITPAIATAFENVPFVPTTETPYQQVTLLPSTPSNPEFGPSYLEQGMFQVNLFYPVTIAGAVQGPAPATARAELIRAAFPRGATLTSGGVTVHIINTTEVGRATADDDRFMVPVKVRWNARIA